MGPGPGFVYTRQKVSFGCRIVTDAFARLGKRKIVTGSQ